MFGKRKNDNNTHNEPKAHLINDIHQHLHILVLRKSAAKLLEYVSYFKNKKDATNYIIQTKYELSKCRPEVLAILWAMASDPKRFQFLDTSTNERMVLDDTAYNEMRFQIYNFGDHKNIRVYINGEKFLTPIEQVMMFNVVKSLNTMRENQYKLQQELETKEVQKNVFETYQNEKRVS